MKANEAYKAISASCIRHMQANQEGMLLAHDPEYLHQMRVALRRLRSALNLFGSVIPRAIYPEISDELKWLLGQLGHARDWDVFMSETLQPLMAQFPMHEPLKAMHLRAIARQQHYNEIACSAMRSRRYAVLLLTLSAWLELEGWRAHLTDVQQQELSLPLDELARRMLGRLHKLIHKRGHHFTQLSVAKRHALRIAAKKLRYAAEFFAELYAHSQVQGYLNALARLQDVLGALNDTATTQRLMASLRTPESDVTYCQAITMAIDWVACRETQLLADMEQTWNAFLLQKPFWKK